MTTVVDNNQSVSALLSTVATVASVAATGLGLQRTDKDASKLAERDHNAKQGIARVNVSRLAGAEERVKEIKSLQTEARAHLFAMTTAWGERRLLPNVNIQRFLNGWAPLKQQFDDKVKKLVDDAPFLIQQAQTNLGSFAIDPPTEEEIAGAFTLKFTMEPVPSAGNFNNTTLDKKLEAALRERFESDVKAAYQQAQRDAMERLAKPLQNIVDRMAAYNQREADLAAGHTVGKEGYFRDSIIQNVEDIADVFESFNLLGDPIMATITDQLEAMRGIDAKDLRNNKDMRDDTARRAADILEKIGKAGWL